MTNMQTKSRNYALDMLRVLACYLVIHQHASEFYYIGPMCMAVKEPSTYILAFLTSLARASVPLFVMLSGYFLLPMRGTASEFFKKRFTRILYPFVAWSVLYAFYYMAERGDSLTQALVHIAHIPVNYGVEVGHLWYIYMLIGLYLLVPVLSPWLERCGRGELRGYLWLWGFTTLLPYIHLLWPEVLGECFWNRSPLLYYFTGFVGYLLLGSYVRRHGALSMPVALVLTVVGYAVTAIVFYARIEGATYSFDMELSWEFCSTNVAIMTWGLFSLFCHVPSEGHGVVAGLVSDISARSYGIYLGHIMLLDQFHKLFAPLLPQVYWAIPVMSVCTLVTVFLLVRLLAHLPLSRYWLG